MILGVARDPRDPSTRHKLALAAFLAWVGLGADGLSSSAYGPEEAYRALGEHVHLALLLVFATAITVLVISMTYTKIIERFPQGGGGYLVATELLGPTVGLVSGSALLVDYVLTITVSIAGGGDAIFSLLPMSWHFLKLPLEFGAIGFLVVMNVRGLKESVEALVPIFLAFVVTHVILIGGGIFTHLGDVGSVSRELGDHYRSDLSTIGAWGMFIIFLRAYSMGGGTYTGIEAVSNAVGALREPRVETARRTMIYMAISLALTAGGLLLCFMLLRVQHQPGRTLNATLAYQWAGEFRLAGIPVGRWFATFTIFTEAVLLLVAAQTGFIDGPRVMANMASDSWLPRRFSALSDRLTMQNGILLMGVAAMLLLAYARGGIQILVVMYSVNVFVTFTLSQVGMLRFWKNEEKGRVRTNNLTLHGAGFLLCGFILMVMVVEKFLHGAWVTIVITSALVALCFGIRRHYRETGARILRFKKEYADLPDLIMSDPSPAPPPPRGRRVAVLLVGGYDGLGVHLLMHVLRIFPNTFDHLVFVSVGLVDSSFFRDEHHVEAVEKRTEATLARFREMGRKLGFECDSASRIGTDVTDEATELCEEVAREHPGAIFFAGELLFERPSWHHRFLHNETAYAIQRRLRFSGASMVILPLVLRDGKGRSA